MDFIRNLFHQPLFVCLLAIIACLCFYFLEIRNIGRRKIISVIFFLLLIISSAIFIGSAIYRVLHPQAWDFTAFYLWGKAAAEGYNFYAPENLHTVFNSINLPFSDMGGFADEIINVGFLYPPPTILYFIPLGFFSFHIALVYWTIFNLVFFGGCIYLCYDLFFKKHKRNGVILVAIFFSILLPSLSTINFSQTNFILFFFLLLSRKYFDQKKSGIFLALAVLVKPYIIILILLFLLKKKWGAVIYFIISILFFTGIVFIFFGKEPFLNYIFNNPSLHLPKMVFSEDVNQSLHAVLLRNNIIGLNASTTYIYIVLTILIVTIYYLFYLLRKHLYESIWAILLLIGLLIYPGTLSHYGVILLFIVFQFFDDKNELGFNVYFSVPIIAVFYYLSTVSVFTCIFFLLIIIISKPQIRSFSIAALTET